MTDEYDNDDNILDRLIKEVEVVIDPVNEDRILERISDLKKSEKKVDSSTHFKKGKSVDSDDMPGIDVSRAKTVANPTDSDSMLGLDIGTSRIIGLRIDGVSEPSSSKDLNAYFRIPYSDLAKQMLIKNNMKYFKRAESLFIYGFDAESFANMFNAEILRPMETGLLKLGDTMAVPAEKKLIESVIGAPETIGESCCFSIPSPVESNESSIVFHEQVLKKYLTGLGYRAQSIFEGTCVVLSELAENNYTGIGISMGAGMCNVSFSFLSVPVMSFGVTKGGDYIDRSVAQIVKEPMNKVRIIKEQSLNLGKVPTNSLENALHVYHEDLIGTLLNVLKQNLQNASNFPQVHEEIPIVISGGTSAPKGFKEKFEKVLKTLHLPVNISHVKVASAPHLAVAKGALINATTMK
ncbi:MAG: hypothetical protein ISR65_03155 [Bacteriovoracaceae bacterium]|nr:hypothetical protein [Bacteriovoracaceae bacterium]